MRKFILLAAYLIVVSGCSSVTLLEPPVLAHWNQVKTDNHLLAKWSGVSPDGGKISYQFNSDQTCIWSYSNVDIHCKFQVTPHEDGFRVLIYKMKGEQFDDVEFIAWVKIENDSMMIYGYPTKFGMTQSGEEAEWPYTFPADSILLKGQEL